MVQGNRRPKAVAAAVAIVTLLAVLVPAATALDLGPVRRSVNAIASVVPVCPPITGQVHCNSLRLTDVKMWEGVALRSLSPAIVSGGPDADAGAVSPLVATGVQAGVDPAARTVPTLPQPGGLLGLLGTTTTTRPPTTTTTQPSTTTTAAPTTTTKPSTTTTSSTVPPLPKGYGPADLQAAYNLPAATAGSGQTIAVVDPFDDPSAESDLGVYRSTYGLPACTTGNGCFKKVNQQGGTSPYPAPDATWSQEASVDLDMVSAACPKCKILLVEANSATVADVAAAENTAAALGANVISNSFTADESVVSPTDGNAYHHPGIAIVAASGDGGYSGGPQFPASSGDVTAVGGTSLKRDGSARGWSETVWSMTGGGCSTVFAKPAWQTDSGCAKRTLADVAAVADPYTGVAAYDSFADGTGSVGWMVFGGTSVSAPIVAGAYALSGNASAGPGYPYNHAGQFYDIKSGSNGTCMPLYLCTAGNGYDGPSGLGTPNGVAGL